MSKTEQNTPGWQAVKTILLLCLVVRKATEYLSHAAYCTNSDNVYMCGNTCGMTNGWRKVK